jgi:hypothetical protein
VDVFATPWGWRDPDRLARPVGGAHPPGQGVSSRDHFAVIDNTFLKLHLYKMTEFMASALAWSAVAVLVLYLGGD